VAHLERQVGFIGALGVLIGVVIGSGIFQTPSVIATVIDSPGLILGLWLLGGLVCLAGAFTYAELAAMHPRSGGVYVFIREAFGSMPAFVFGWTFLLLVKPFAAGGIAFVFAIHFNMLFGTSLDPRVLTTVMLLSLTIINYRGVGLATGVGVVLTSAKVAALAFIVLLTLALGYADVANLAPPDPQALAPSRAALLGALVIAMSGILWTYDGWADVGSIAGEVKRPQVMLPRIYLLGTGLVIVLYLLVNAAYFMLVPLVELRSLALASPGLSVAPIVVERLVGPIGASILAGVVMLSALGSSHASIMTGARVSYAQARDGLLFSFIGRVHPRYKTPDVALFSQVGLACVAVWLLGSFQSLAESFVFTMWIFHALAGSAIFILRRRESAATRPFRCPGYPVVPALFILAAIGMTTISIVDGPSKTLPWLGVLLAGVPVYYVWRRFVPVTAAGPDPAVANDDAS
jgi:basic amino acid/polyamine antiporter, APA family